MENRIKKYIYLAIALGLSFWVHTAQAEHPTRAARLSEHDGIVSFLPVGKPTWIQPNKNQPLITGDKLWNDKNALATLQLAGGTICVGSNSSITVFKLDEDIAQFQLLQGALILNISSVLPNQSYEVDTPQLALSITEPGAYKIQVDEEGNATTLMVTQGKALVYGEKNILEIKDNKSYRFIGTDLQMKHPQNTSAHKEVLERWCSEHAASAVSAGNYIPELAKEEHDERYDDRVFAGAEPANTKPSAKILERSALAKTNRVKRHKKPKTLPQDDALDQKKFKEKIKSRE